MKEKRKRWKEKKSKKREAKDEGKTLLQESR